MVRIKKGCYCCAVNCKKNQGADRNLSFFRFPCKDPERCKKWAINTRRADLIEKENAALKNYNLCALHFEDSQFMNANEKKRLIWSAVPTLFDVPNPPPKINDNSGRAQRAKRRADTKVNSEVVKKKPLNMEITALTPYGPFIAREVPVIKETIEEKKKNSPTLGEFNEPRTVSVETQTNSNFEFTSPLSIPNVAVSLKTPSLTTKLNELQRVSLETLSKPIVFVPNSAMLPNMATVPVNKQSAQTNKLNCPTLQTNIPRVSLESLPKQNIVFIPTSNVRPNLSTAVPLNTSTSQIIVPQAVSLITQPRANMVLIPTSAIRPNVATVVPLNNLGKETSKLSSTLPKTNESVSLDKLPKSNLVFIPTTGTTSTMGTPVSLNSTVISGSLSTSKTPQITAPQTVSLGTLPKPNLVFIPTTSTTTMTTTASLKSPSTSLQNEIRTVSLNTQPKPSFVFLPSSAPRPSVPTAIQLNAQTGQTKNQNNATLPQTNGSQTTPNSSKSKDDTAVILVPLNEYPEIAKNLNYQSQQKKTVPKPEHTYSSLLSLPPHDKVLLIQKQERKIEELQRTLQTTRTKKKSLYQQANRLKKKFDRVKMAAKEKTELHPEEIIKAASHHMSALQSSFFASQIKLQSRCNHGRRWTSLSKGLALAIYYISPKCYRFLQTLFCLPSRRTLHHSLRNNGVDVAPILKNDTLEIVKKKVTILMKAIGSDLMEVNSSAEKGTGEVSNTGDVPNNTEVNNMEINNTEMNNTEINNADINSREINNTAINNMEVETGNLIIVPEQVRVEL